MNLILSVLLVLSPIGPLFEPVKIHDSLVLEAEYLEKGHKLNREVMAFSIADFALLQSEVEFAGEAWELRVQDLIKQHKDSIKDMQTRFEQELSLYKEELLRRDKHIANKQVELTKAQADLKQYKLLCIGVSIIATGALIYGFMEK